MHLLRLALAGGGLLLAQAAGVTGGQSSTPAGPTFVGAQACASCHQQNHEKWTAGRHSRMVQPASAASVVGDFSQREVTLRDKPYRLREARGSYFITESQLAGESVERRVDYTLGNRRIQHYLTTLDDGRIIVLAPTWDVMRRQWFHNMDIVRPVPGFRGSEVPGFQQWNKDCVGCHVSQQQKNYDPRTQKYDTRWTDFGTTCERCHGPGSAHVAAYATARPGLSPGADIVRPTRLDATRSSMICAQCHSLRTALTPTFRAGSDYYDSFVPVLEYAPYSGDDRPYWPDGRPRRFSNDAFGLWQSACFLEGGATCTTCHLDPHLPDVEKNPQLAASDDALCTTCHSAIGQALTAHTRHRADSDGSRCVECHMPKTVVSIKATMRDHTMSVPAPENTVRHGIPNACTECHADRNPAWAVEAMASRWPARRRMALIARADAFAAARARRPEALDRLLAIARDGAFDPLTRANAIGHLGRIDAPRASAALTTAARSGHAALRMTAVAALGEHARDPAAHEAIARALDDPRRAVRVTALMSLINLGLGAIELTPALEQGIGRASREFADWAALHRDDAELQRALGIVHLLAGEFDRAADALEISLGLNPGVPSGKFLLALARIGQRRYDDASRLLKDVPKSDPYYDGAQERLKQPWNAKSKSSPPSSF